MLAEHGGRDVTVDRLVERGAVDVAGKLLGQGLARRGQHLRLGHPHPAADQNPLRRGDQDEAGQHLADILSGDQPGRVVGRYVLGRHARAGGDRRTGGEAFQAIAVDRADAGKIVAGDPPHHDMAHLGMEQAMDRPAVGDQAAADPGPDRQIGNDVEAGAAAPAPFGQRGGVDVGVDRDPAVQAVGHAADVEPLPAGFRSAHQPAVIIVIAVEDERPEAGDAERAERRALLPSGENLVKGSDRRLAVARLDPLLGNDRRAAGEHRNALGSAQLDAGNQWLGLVHCFPSPPRRALTAPSAQT